MVIARIPVAQLVKTLEHKYRVTTIVRCTKSSNNAHSLSREAPFLLATLWHEQGAVRILEYVVAQNLAGIWICTVHVIRSHVQILGIRQACDPFLAIRASGSRILHKGLEQSEHTRKRERRCNFTYEKRCSTWTAFQSCVID